MNQFLGAPLAWGMRAARLSSRAFLLGCLLWSLARQTGSPRVELSRPWLDKLGFGKRGHHRVLRQLEQANLVAIALRPGLWPTITIIDGSLKEEEAVEQWLKMVSRNT